MFDDVHVERRAWREVRRAFAWYQARDERVALRFLDEFWHGLEQIAEHRDRWPRYDNRHRFILMRRFPYLLIFRTDFDRSIVTAVAHGRRRSGYWKRRKRRER